MTGSQKQKRVKILCADDDPVVLTLYGKHIQNAGYELITAKDGSEALQLARKHTPDLIISDVDMPGMNGFELCKEIRNDSVVGASIFLLASSIFVDSADAVRGLDAGADDYLIKPVRKEELIAKLRAFLRIKFLQDDLFQSNRKLKKAVQRLRGYKKVLETKKNVLSREKNMLENSLKQISLMVEEREQTNSELERMNRLQTDNFDSLITLLSATIESKRQYHRGHSKKVGEIAAFIARELAVSEKDIRNIEIASLLHEIGKLSLPDVLAMKNPGDYTQSEKNFLIQHPVKGASLLEGFSDFDKVSKIIRHFHEYIDGKGVPAGLKGEKIPLGSRIIAVANLFDNLVYRKKDGLVEDAFEKIEQEVGTRFDARVVNALHKYANMHPVSEKDRTQELKIYEIESGMTLASGVFTQSGTKLLPRNTVLTDESLNKIANYNKMEPIQDTIFIRQ